MYDFTGCECTICHQHFKIDSDIVVCPDCGTPYHRDCYASLGHCKHQDAHGKDFCWQPLEEITRQKMKTCPRCNAENEKTNLYCNHCGILLDTEDNIENHSVSNYNAASNTQAEQSFSLFEQMKADAIDPFGSMDQNELVDDIPVAEWAHFIGAASPVYLRTFQQMKLLKRKFSFSFSAMLFGPFYFFYRKTWDVALFFSIIALLLNLPSLLMMLVYSESIYAPAISLDALSVASQAAVSISWAVMMLRGLYGVHLYKLSSAKTIKKIQQRSTTPKEKAFLLKMYGGTSFGAVFLALGGMIVLASAFTFLLGPNSTALFEAFY